MFRTEDDRFELDIAIEQNQAAMKAIDTMVNEWSTMKPSEQDRYDWSPIFQPLYMKAINRMYGDKGGEILSCVRRNPSFALPLIYR